MTGRCSCCELVNGVTADAADAADARNVSPSRQPRLWILEPAAHAIEPLFLKAHFYVLVICGNELFMDDVTELV